MFLPFVYELRRRGLPVGTQESLALARALSLGLHESSLEGFYHTARALLVHREEHLDEFDVVFASYFQGITRASKQITEEMRSWLRGREEAPRAQRRGEGHARGPRPRHAAEGV
jgi:uncharacterized protein with von Willebrand factor type A (vWA) domain